MMKKKTPYVSVVMTSYNREKYIGQAIDSILSQECEFPFEIIIGDDCSTDGSRDLLAAYKEKFPEIFVFNFHETNQGFGANWASTCKLARGKYIAFLDDDDYWCDNGRMQQMVDVMDADENVGLVYTNRYIYEVETGVKRTADVFLPEGANMVGYMTSKGFPIFFSATMLRKSLMDQYVNLDDYIRLKFPIQDWPTAMMLAPHCKFKYIEKPSVMYRYYQGSMSKPQGYDQIIKKYSAEKMMYKYIMEKLGMPFDEKGYDDYVNHLLMSLAYKRGDYREAKKFAKMSREKTIKALCSRTWMSFQLFRLAKRLKENKL